MQTARYHEISTAYFTQSRKYKKVSEVFFSRAVFDEVYRLSLTSWHELMVIINKKGFKISEIPF